MTNRAVNQWLNDFHDLAYDLDGLVDKFREYIETISYKLHRKWQGKVSLDIDIYIYMCVCV
ncbi:unnamed protein product [Camellia sinensis]